MCRGKTDHGTTAIVVAIMATLLFSIAALSFDLGNAWARKRDVQTQVDMAALAGAARLPSGTNNAEIADDAADYLNRNKAPGQQDVTGADLTDPDPLNGNIEFIGSAKIRVTAPVATVDFGFASVMGYDDVDVTAKAAVGILSPGTVEPFFMPSSCSWGTQVIKASAHAPEPSPVFATTDPDTNSGNLPDPGRVDPLEVQVDTPSQVTVEGKKYGSHSGPPYSSLRVSFTRDDKTHYNSALSLTHSGQTDTLTVDVPTAVLNTPGVWYMRIQNSFGWSKQSQALPFRVATPADPTPGCGVKVEGDFGLLDSPRGGVTTGAVAERLALNIALGLDHDIQKWPSTSTPPTGDKACQPYSSPVPAAVLDDGSPNPNCMNILTGNKVDMVTDGLVAGVGDVAGRLVAETTPNCDRNGGSSTMTVLGVSGINADVLSCFLPSGVTVGEVSRSTSPAEHVIDPAIFDSPRFMWVPLIGNSINPPNGFYPVVGFRPAFITDETMTAMNGSSNATSINGLATSSTKVTAVTVVAINPDSLPETTSSTAGGVPYLGVGTKLLRLVE
jgi:hypothetical protein